MYIARARGEAIWAVGSSSLVIGTGHWIQVFSLILDSSVGLSVGIQSVGDSVPETRVRILHSAKEDYVSPFDSIDITSLLPVHTKINTNKYTHTHTYISLMEK